MADMTAEYDIGIEGLTWLSEIGSGGFGSVHRARDEAHGRDVAVKLLHAAATDDRSRARFDRERRLMGTVSNHPNVVTIHTSGFTAAGVPFIVMELIEGGTLSDRLDHGPMDTAMTLALGSKLGDALAAAHDSGILHLDLKPDNVLIGANSEPLLADFGIASSMSEVAQRHTISISPSYSPPEVLNNVGVDARADVYSLASTLYSCLTARKPYDYDGVMDTINAVATEPTPRVELATVSAPLADLLVRAMAKDPNDRPGTMHEFTARLAEVAGGRQAAPASTWEDAAPQTIVHPFAGQPAAAPAHAGSTPVHPPAPVPAHAGPTSRPPVLSDSSRPPGQMPPVLAGVRPPPPLPPQPSKATWKLPVGILVAVLLVLGGVVAATGIGDGSNERATELSERVGSNLADLPTPAPPRVLSTDPTPVPAPTPRPTGAPAPTPRPTGEPAPTATPRPNTAPTAVPVSAVALNADLDFVWSEAIDSQGDPISPIPGVAPPGLPSLCVSFETRELIGGQIDFAWWFPEFDIDRTFTADIDGVDDQWWACIGSRDLCNTCEVIPDGIVNFEFSVGGELVVTHERRIGVVDLHPIEFANGGSQALCEINVSDVASRTWGPNVLGRPLEPGDVIEVLRPEAEYDVRGFGCDGVELDQSSFVIDGPFRIDFG